MTTDTVRVAANQESLQVNPGEQVETVITIQNLGVAVGVFSIEVEGLDPSWYWLSSSSISLFPGDSTTAGLTVSPPKFSGSLAQTYPFTVKVTSQRDESEQASVSLSLEVLPFYELLVDMTPQRVTGRRGIHTLTITNTGNTSLSFDIEGRDPESLCHFSFNPETPTVPPGEILSVEVTVDGKRPLRGMPKVYQYNLTVAPREGALEPTVVLGELEVPPRLPAWVPRLAIFGVLAVGVGIAVWWFFFYEAQVPVEALKVSPVRVSLTEGETIQLVAVARDAEGNELVGHEVSWESKDASVILVSASGGLVRAIAPGSALIEATLLNQSLEPSSATITVLPTVVSVDCIRYDPTDLRFGVSEGNLVLKSGGAIVLTLNEADDQDNAINIVRRHTARCFIGRGEASVESQNHELEFWTGSSGNDTAIEPPDCEEYSQANLQIRAQNDGRWLLTDGGALQIQLDSQQDAQNALILTKRHSSRCFISRDTNAPNPKGYLTQYWE